MTEIDNIEDMITILYQCMEIAKGNITEYTRFSNQVEMLEIVVNALKALDARITDLEP